MTSNQAPQATRLPLGAVESANLDARARNHLMRVAYFDLSRIKFALLCKGLMPEAHIDAAIEEFRRFIAMCVIDSTEYTMISADVDDVWHEAILHTRLYQDFCETVAGRYIHHERECECENFLFTDRRGVQIFEMRYQELFGELPSLWLAPQIHN